MEDRGVDYGPANNLAASAVDDARHPQCWIYRGTTSYICKVSPGGILLSYRRRGRCAANRVAVIFPCSLFLLLQTEEETRKVHREDIKKVALDPFSNKVDIPPARKSLGQNFLLDKTALNRIVSFLPSGSSGLVIEIGTGTGHLTKLLCGRFQSVVTIEKDDRLIEWLYHQGHLPENCRLIHKDVLEVSFVSIIKDMGCRKAVLAGNLPYNISSQIVFKLCAEQEVIPAALFLFQKEVAERITSSCSRKTYGVLSLVAQYFFDVKKVMDISPNLFRPRPKVVSSVVLFERKKAGPCTKCFHTFLRVVKAAFSQRRKKITNSLSHQLKIPKKDMAEILKNVGIDPSSRAGDISLEHFIFLSNTLGKTGKFHGRLA